MKSPDILASFFTIAGDCVLEMLGGTEASPFDLRDRIEAAGAAGFTGIGFGHRDLVFWGEHYSARDIGSMLADNGIGHVELEMLFGWYSDGEERDRSDAVRRDLLRWSEALGPSHIKVGTDFSERHWELGHIAQHFAQLCREADAVGTAIALEPMPITTIRTPRQALEMIDLSGAANGGVILDTLHMMRGGIDFETLADLPGERILAVELCDGLAEPVEGSIVVDATDFRMRPGCGTFDMAGFITAVRKTGFDRPFGIEILSIENRSLALAEAAILNFEAARRALDAAILGE